MNSGRYVQSDCRATPTWSVTDIDVIVAVVVPLYTVRESLMFSASLRLPRSVSQEQKKKFVEELLWLLQLDVMADRLIGDESTPGLEPAQLKLVTMGVELAANPSILFLDEPTR
jgi:ABC-type multidrug transport system ATPase subunit